MHYYLHTLTNKVLKYEYSVNLDTYKNVIEITKAQFKAKRKNHKLVWNGSDFIIPVKTLPDKKAEKNGLLENWKATELAKGFSYNGNTFLLSKNKKTNIADQWLEMEMNLKAGELEKEQTAYLTNTDKKQIEMNYNEFVSFASGYAKKYKSVIVAYSKKRNDLFNAENQTDLDKVTI